MATRQQRWSSKALACVEERQAEGQAKDFAISKYKTRCLSTPSLVQQAGVVQALAFIISRDQTGRDFADDLAQTYGLKDRDELLRKAQNGGLGEYMTLSADLISVATWFRRFAKSELTAVEEDDS